jgi:hypothetical protein
MPARKIAEAQSANANSDKAFHFVTDFVKHPANLTINSLPQNHAQPRRLEWVDCLEARALAVQHDAAQQFRSERRVPRAIERDLVFLFDLESRMSQPLGEIAVIREEKQAFGLRVEAADVEKSRQMGREKIEDRIARIRIASRRNETGRLMQHDVEPPLAVNEFAVDFNVVAVPGLRAEISADLAVDRDATGRDQFIAMPARTKPGRGKETIQAHGRARGLNVRLRFRQAEDLLALLELAAFLQKFDALETLQNVSLRRDGAGAFEAAMLRHKLLLFFRGFGSAHLTALLGFFNPGDVPETGPGYSPRSLRRSRAR